MIIDHKPIEITTFRCDEGYTDYRRPDNVEFVKDVYIDSMLFIIPKDIYMISMKV